MVLHYSGNALLRLWLIVLSSDGVHYFVEPRIFQLCPGHPIKVLLILWLNMSCVCVLVCMTVCVGGGRDKLCWCGMLHWGVPMFGGVCFCCLISWESWSIWDCRFCICLLCPMAFSLQNLTWLSASSSLLWASSLTIWRSLWCCMIKFCLIHFMLILCPSSNSAFNLFNSKVEGVCWGWLLELLFDWHGSLSELPIADPRWSKGELLLVGIAYADCIILLTLLMVVWSRFLLI